MSITPQLIKDQEFEIKFRGFDPIEVRDYLETIADTFFELQEQCKEREGELDSLRQEKESSEEYNTSLETDMEFTRKISDELKDGCAQKEEKVNELTAEVEELQLRMADMEQEGKEYEEELSAVEAGWEEAKEALKDARAESVNFQNKIELQQDQINDLKKEEVVFRSTLASAQRFAEEMKEKSKAEAEEVITRANNEINQIREDARAELDRLPQEIVILEKKKQTVREELKAVLEKYMEAIDVFALDGKNNLIAASNVATENEETDLFQKIELNEDGSMRSEDALASGPEMDEKALDSLLRGENPGNEDNDTFELTKMFHLGAEEEKKESS